MGNLLNKEPPPPLVLVPPIFDFPPLAARTRMLVPAYDLLFGKLALQCLFEDYMEDARNFSMRIMLKPLEDPHVDLAATIKSCVYHPKLGLGIFGFLPCSTKRRTCSENSGFIGMRYGSEKLSVGASFDPFPLSFGFPGCAWVVGRTGRLCAGVLYKPPGISKGRMSIWEPKNWNWAVSYVVGSGSPLSPSFSFALELAANSELIASFYRHLVVQRRVKNPFEANQIVGITNYVDFGIELKTRIDDYKPTVGDYRPSFQMAASWQANKNILIKGKIGSSLSSLALAFKSWWKPSFTFSITAVNNLSGGGTSFGFGIRIEDLREPRYERADPNYVMLTPTKEHLAEGVLREFGTQPMFQSNVESGNFEGLPTELKPMWKII
ncbi:beta-galactosidase isoform X4 [Wolffia australiana]